MVDLMELVWGNRGRECRDLLPKTKYLKVPNVLIPLSQSFNIIRDMKTIEIIWYVFLIIICSSFGFFCQYALVKWIINN